MNQWDLKRKLLFSKLDIMQSILMEEKGDATKNERVNYYCPTVPVKECFVLLKKFQGRGEILTNR